MLGGVLNGFMVGLKDAGDAKHFGLNEAINENAAILRTGIRGVGVGTFARPVDVSIEAYNFISISKAL
jgi:hypothetical protein